MDLLPFIRDIPNFPKPGIIFKDVTPLLKDAAAFRAAVDALAAPYRHSAPDLITAVESRGFIFGAPVAERLGCGFVPMRKPGKLPAATARVEYVLEYGTDTIEVHRDAITEGVRVLVLDDVLATGGTAAAAGRLVQQLGGTVVGYAFLIELGFLGGRSRLNGFPVDSVLIYP